MAIGTNRILVFTTAFRPFIGGSELAIEEINRRLPEFFFEILTPRYKKELPTTEKGANFSVYRLGYGSGLDKFLFPLTGFLKARELLKNTCLTFHSYQASYGAGAAWMTRTFYKDIPFLLTVQEGKDLDGQNFIIRFFRKLIIKKADRATAISNYLKNYVLKINNDIRTDLIPNGVDVGSFSKEFSYGDMANAEKEIGIMPDDKIIISVSRLVPKNGVDLLIEALKNLGGEYKLLLVGDGPMRLGLVSRVKESGLEKRVIFAGSARPDELPLYLKISDVFARPSRSEGLGTAFLEAMAAKIPVIGTRVGGIPDFLEDRKTGLYCSLEPGDIAFKIRTAVENDKLRQEMISNAYQMVSEKYDWNIIADKFRKLYQELQ